MKNLIGGGLLASIFGNLVWILGLINIVWLLAKDCTLFSWWWVIGSATLFIVGLLMSLYAIVTRYL